jgi:hypothetical protein
MHENMAPALVIDDITDPAEGLDDLFSGKCPAQT